MNFKRLICWLIGHVDTMVISKFTDEAWEQVKHRYYEFCKIYNVCKRCGKGSDIIINIDGADHRYKIKLEDHEPKPGKKT